MVAWYDWRWQEWQAGVRLWQWTNKTRTWFWHQTLIMMILLSQLLIRSWHISVIDQSNILLAPPIITIIRGDNNVLLRQWRVLMRTRFMCVTCLNHLLACWECSNYCSYHQAFQSSIFTTGNIIRDRKQYCSLAGHYTPSSWSWHHPSLHADIYKVAPSKLMVAALTDSIYIHSFIVFNDI